MKEVRTDIKKYSAAEFIHHDLVLWFRGTVSLPSDPRFKRGWVAVAAGGAAAGLALL